MFVIGNFLQGIAQVLDIILTIYMWVIVISALLSWVNPDPNNPIVRILRTLSEPVLRPIRRYVGFGLGMDVSPIVAILVIMFLRYFVVQSLLELSAKL